MPIDDSFLKREADKRRALTILLVAVIVNFVIIVALFGSGYFFEEPFIGRVILYSEGIAMGILYWRLRKNFKSDDAR